MVVALIAAGGLAAVPSAQAGATDPIGVDPGNGGGEGNANAQCDALGTVCAGAAAVASDQCVKAEASGAIALFPAEGDIEICWSFALAGSNTYVCDTTYGSELRFGHVSDENTGDDDGYDKFEEHNNILLCTSSSSSAWISSSTDHCVKSTAGADSSNGVFFPDAAAEAQSQDCADSEFLTKYLVEKASSGAPTSSSGPIDGPSIGAEDSDLPTNYSEKAQGKLSDLGGETRDKIVNTLHTLVVDGLKDDLLESVHTDEARETGLKLIQSIWSSEGYKELTVNLYDVPG